VGGIPQYPSFCIIARNTDSHFKNEIVEEYGKGSGYFEINANDMMNKCRFAISIAVSSIVVLAAINTALYPYFI
jgi:hypothetical protein